MIFIAIGSNLPTEKFGSPFDNCREAVRRMPAYGIKPVQFSKCYQTEPVPKSDQPDYVNAVIAVETLLAPDELLRALRKIEQQFGRVRTEQNAARTLDLDIVSYNDEIVSSPPDLILPHPRMQDREFVLRPLADIAPNWVHPENGQSALGMLQKNPKDTGSYRIKPLAASLY